MNKQRKAIVQAARTWLGTHFHHQGRIKKSSFSNGGVDCLGLIIGVAEELNLKNENGDVLSSFDENDYSVIPDSIRLIQKLKTHLKEIKFDEIELGDILLIKFDENPQHLAIVTELENRELGIIHCYRQAGMVVEHRLDDFWKNKIYLCFSIFN